MLLNLQQAALERVEAATTGFGRLPDEVWFVVAKHLDEYDRIAFGLTCKTFLETVTAASPKEKKKALTLRTNLAQKTLLKQMPRFSMGWFQWVFQSFERKKGVLNAGDLDSTTTTCTTLTCCVSPLSRAASR